MKRERREGSIASRTRTCILCNTVHTVPSVHTRGLFCPSCKTPQLVRESDRVRSHVGNAERSNLPATLTVLEWLRILDHFGWKCAYCKISRFEVLEHVVSMTNGGGTTSMNVVPACLGCNASKDRLQRPSYEALPQERIYRVQNELLQLFVNDGVSKP